MGKFLRLLLLTVLVLPACASTCTTRWFDRDDPSGVGDFETLADLRKEYPMDICPKPTGIEAQTVEGTPASSTGQIFHPFNPKEGFACVNKEQKYFCLDYKVRFTCPSNFCSGCTTRWFDRDNPSGKGDYELLSNLRSEYPGGICDEPLAINVQTVDGRPAVKTGQRFSVYDTTRGFACVNTEQVPGQSCLDYVVQFTCPESFCSASTCTTRWFDRDDPSGVGDFETLADLRREYPTDICPEPIGIEAQTVEGTPASSTGQIFHPFNPKEGFACVNKEQYKRSCLDYKVRFTCPSNFCSGCMTQWFDRDGPSGRGDYELLSNLRSEYPGKICAEPLAINVQTLDGIPALKTGQKFSVYDPTQGFACVNDEQKPGRSCHDYRVQFTCPGSFCSG
ncbi:Uncharacterized protein PODLI_1B026164 [Podarcis lilfordi]|uniref:WxxW domain-containing protein n=1 Tax=Podarcis lilfordi TaxID=74358 RepID=A0AA35PBD6_9SAUR|nr:Uncharacterized protein PODLI_1B026164 [Podarcis lilfordi]